MLDESLQRTTHAMTLVEIAEATGMSLRDVKTLYESAIRKLRRDPIVLTKLRSLMGGIHYAPEYVN